MNGTGDVLLPATKCPRSRFAALYFASANAASQIAGVTARVAVITDLHLVLVGELYRDASSARCVISLDSARAPKRLGHLERIVEFLIGEPEDAVPLDDVDQHAGVVVLLPELFDFVERNARAPLARFFGGGLLRASCSGVSGAAAAAAPAALPAAAGSAAPALGGRAAPRAPRRRRCRPAHRRAPAGPGAARHVLVPAFAAPAIAAGDPRNNSTGCARSSTRADVRLHATLQDLVASRVVAGAEVVRDVHSNLNARPLRIRFLSGRQDRRFAPTASLPARPPA